MKLICAKSDLLNGVQIVSKAVPSKTTMSILECILIDASKGIIKLTANDTELGIDTIIEGEIIEKGIVALDAKIFFEIIRKLPDNNITIDTDSNFKTVITCEKAKFVIVGKSGEDFSYLPVIEKNVPVVLSQFTLKEAVRQTIFSISDNDSSKQMTGELFEINNDNLRLASLDGHRISIRNIKMKNSYDYKKVIIPGKTLNEISKILSGDADKDINIYFTDKHVLFEFNNTTVVSRLIEGEYYKIDQMLSNDYETKVKINKKELLSCIIRSTVGSMNEEIDIDKNGRDLMIGFNPKFLIDALRVIDEETISIYLMNAKSPCFIRDDYNNYIYLILPVNFTEVDYV